jgi:hypothetical protein
MRDRMSLHGEICVNHRVIGTWMARRMENLAGMTATHRYEYEVWMGEDKVAAGELEHRYSDGAVALAAMVLARAAYAHGDAVLG